MLKLLGKPVAEKIEKNVRERVHFFKQKNLRSPSLVVILIGNNPASEIYTKKKGEAAKALNISHQTITLPETTSTTEMKALIDALNKDPTVDGILIQRPLPQHFKEEDVVFWIDPDKDVDAFHPVHTGRLVLGLPTLQPCTPTGVMEMFKHYHIDLSGKIACVIGRSAIVGKPIATLLLQSNVTLLHCHSKTPDLRQMTRQAELLIVAAGKPGLIDASYIRPHAVVIDVGIHRTASGQVIGDVAYDSATTQASAITPVPGGVGVMTIAILMQNTVFAAEYRNQT